MMEGGRQLIVDQTRPTSGTLIWTTNETATTTASATTIRHAATDEGEEVEHTTTIHGERRRRLAEETMGGHVKEEAEAWAGIEGMEAITEEVAMIVTLSRMDLATETVATTEVLAAPPTAPTTSQDLITAADVIDIPLPDERDHDQDPRTLAPVRSLDEAVAHRTNETSATAHRLELALVLDLVRARALLTTVDPLRPSPRGNPRSTMPLLANLSSRSRCHQNPPSSGREARRYTRARRRRWQFRSLKPTTRRQGRLRRDRSQILPPLLVMDHPASASTKYETIPWLIPSLSLHL